MSDKKKQKKKKQLKKKFKKKLAQETEFLNVDLEIDSPENLSTLINALTPVACDLYHEPNETGFFACLSLNTGERLDADTKIRAFAEALLILPADAKSLWEKATRRCFSIGIEAGFANHQFSLILQPDTIEMMTKLNASVEFVVYTYISNQRILRATYKNHFYNQPTLNGNFADSIFLSKLILKLKKSSLILL